MTYLRSNEISKHEGKHEQQNPYTVPSHMLSFVFLNIHVIEVSGIFRGYFYHGGARLYGGQPISESFPNILQHLVCYQEGFVSRFARSYKVGSTESHRILVQGGRNDMISKKSQEKLMQFLLGNTLEDIKKIALKRHYLDEDCA